MLFTLKLDSVSVLFIIPHPPHKHKLPKTQAMRYSYMMKLVVFSIGIALVAIAFAYYYFQGGTKMVVSAPPAPPATPTVVIGRIHIPVEIAQGLLAVQKGLSGRPTLDAESGMIFLFPAPARHKFWMPDMHFPIDIIWINEGKVIDISHNVSNTFNILKPKFYSPKEPVQYVLEVNAGFAEKKGIAIGDAVLFKHITAK